MMGLLLRCRLTLASKVLMRRGLLFENWKSNWEDFRLELKYFSAVNVM
jgi:hypothetical protein